MPFDARADELSRLSELATLGILDTPPEAEFDDITSLAGLVCGVPTALLTLIDERRQWFKSRVSFPFTESPREIAFCAHTIAQDDVMVVPDAAIDPRFANNPLVTGEPRIRFYAGAPLMTAPGATVGSLAVIDYVPRVLSPQQIDGLRRLARQAVAQLQLRRRVLAEREDARRASEALASVERRRAAIIESALDCIIVIDQTGHIVEFNPAAERTFGFARAEARGCEMAELIVPPEDRDRHRAGLQRYLATREGRILNRRIELTAMRRDGTRFPVELTVTAIGDDPVLFAGFLRDLTERRRADEMLRQAQKMDSIGQLSGGVAHDFNNILTVVQGNAGMLAESLGGGDAELAREIVAAAERGAALTRQLMTFSRQQPMRPAEIDLSAVASNMTRMLQRLIGATVTLETDYPAGLPPVEADTGMIEQVLLNLAVNARDAMRGSGVLRISTGVRGVAANEAERTPNARAGEHVFLRVSDSGEGIPPDVLPRIFEPFFTTKDPGKGTGLGLATVYGIARQHGGWVNVASTPGAGATFELMLPPA